MDSKPEPLYSLNGTRLWMKTAAFCLRESLDVISDTYSTACCLGERGGQRNLVPYGIFMGKKNPHDAFEMFLVLLSILFFTLNFHKGIYGSILYSCCCMHYFVFFLVIGIKVKSKKAGCLFCFCGLRT